MPIEEWVNSTDMIGDNAKSLFPKLKEDMIEIFRGPPLKPSYHEVVLTGSIGYGKDYFSTFAMMRMLYVLNCLKDPPTALGLGAGEQIHFVIVSRTIDHAKKIAFGGLVQKMRLAPWFKGRFHETQEYVNFGNKNIYILGGSSSDSGVLGFNVYGALMDEGNFMGSTRASQITAGGYTLDRAQQVYDALVRRVASRFKAAGLKGMMFMISSKRASEDFTERRIREAIKERDGQGLYVMDYNTWMVRPQAFENQRWYRVSLRNDGRIRVLDEGESDPEESLCFNVPQDYVAQFRSDPVGATRDVAGICTDAVSPFIADRQALEAMFDEDMASPFDHPEWVMDKPLDIYWHRVRTVNARNEPIPLCCPQAKRHVHLDMSKNSCATGFCMVHQAGTKEIRYTDPETGAIVTQELPLFHIDGILRIVAPQGGDIDHATVRNLVFRFIEAGFNVRSVSMDQWMHVPNEQWFRQHGLATEVISTVRTLDPYLAARAATNEGRIKSPPHGPLKHELTYLELGAQGKKVVAPSGKTKDVADAWAGAIYFVSKGAHGGLVAAPAVIQRTPVDARPPVRMLKGGEIKWRDEEDEEASDRLESDGLGISIVR